jgi:SH3-like domain-containing protein
MRFLPRNQDHSGGQVVLVALLAGAFAGAQEPAVAPPAAPATAPAAAAPTPAAPAAPALAAPAVPGPAEPAAPAPAEKTAEAPQTGVVTANLLVVRARPAPHYERIGQFARGEEVTIVGSTADWFEVRVPADTRAWIAAQFVSTEGMVTGDQVRLHCGPGLVFTTFAMVRQGAKLDVVGPPVDGWQQVRAPADATAWVSRAYIRVLEPEPPPATTVPAAETAGPATESAAPAAEAAPTAPAVPESPATGAAEKPAAEGVSPAAAPAGEPAAPASAAPEDKPETAQTEAKAPPAAETAATGPAAPAQETSAKAEEAAPAEGAAPGPAAPVAEAPAAPAAAETPSTPLVLVPPADAPVVMKEGVLLSLRSQASEQASHVLCLRVEATAYPVCYLKSVRLDLSEWENRSVRVYGRELRIPGWSLAVLHVHSIQVNLK